MNQTIAPSCKLKQTQDSRLDVTATGSVKRFLDKKYPGCRTPAEAIEVARFNLRVQRELNKTDPDGGGSAS